ncbi:unnamed protein product [Candidula unifasciata]|uniref:alpha-L-fucosidase n=1 Tax=Candidula unifasciata TaxID=100452 RepID=A0A8S4A4B7_9EUPU|nr:unnamed protein product [Candidula unifasciata]
MKQVLDKMKLVLLLLCLVLHSAVSTPTRYEPNWESLDARPLPEWYDDGKIGIFIHWGVFSVPAYGSEWFWFQWLDEKRWYLQDFMKDNYAPSFTYQDFAPMFHAEFYDPDHWADVLQASGASHVVFVAKHHEGYTNWPSKFSFSWNSEDVGPKKDLVGLLADAVRAKTNLKFGLYHSMFEWYHPLFLQDQANGFKTQDFVQAKTMPELYELVNKYKPEIVWSDGEWLATDQYWNSTEFIAWLYNDSPVKDTVVVNDRWGNNTRCAHGGFWNCKDHYVPSTLVPHKWESCLTIDRKSWGYRADTVLEDVYTIEELIDEVIFTISLGGNILINIGPTSRGEIPPVFEERLRQLGKWLKVNGEAIYKTHVWSNQSDIVAKDVRYTARTEGNATTVYAILPDWPATGNITLGSPIASASTNVSLVGYPGNFQYTSLGSGGITVTLPPIPVSRMPCEWSYVLRLEGLQNQKTELDESAYSKNLQALEMRKDFPMPKVPSFRVV